MLNKSIKHNIYIHKLQGWDVESNSGRPPIGSEGGRYFVHAKVLDH